MRKIIAIGGEPATGKSTLIKCFMQHMDWVEKEEIKLVPTLYNERNNLHILGKYPDGEPFGGTDRYSMAVQPQAVKFIQNTNANILFEGDRLFNQTFLEFLSDLPDTDLKIIYLEAQDKTIAERHISRKDSQSEIFKKGRRTKIENLQSNMVLMGYSNTWVHENLDDTLLIVDLLIKELT